MSFNFSPSRNPLVQPVYGPPATSRRDAGSSSPLLGSGPDFVLKFVSVVPPASAGMRSLLADACSEFHRSADRETAARIVRFGYFLAFVERAAVVRELGELAQLHPVADEVLGAQPQLPAFAQPFGEHEIEGVARHLVHVGNVVVHAAARREIRAADADDAFAYAVVEHAYGQPRPLRLIEKSAVDDVGRLSLHRAVVLHRRRVEKHPALDERDVERQRDAGHPHEV